MERCNWTGFEPATSGFSPDSAALLQNRQNVLQNKLCKLRYLLLHRVVCPNFGHPTLTSSFTNY